MYAVPVSQRSRVRIPQKPEFFSALLFAAAKVPYITAMIFFHVRNSYSYVKINKILYILGAGKNDKGALEPKAQTAGAYPSFLSMKHAQKNCYFPLDGMLVHRRVTPSSISLVPIYTPG